MPGKPYVAKWPDKFGNLKQRPVTCPDIIGKYFSKYNIIDVGNGLRQNELAPERHWQTKDPWFRIDCTVVGVSVIDGYLAAQYQAPSCARIDKMSVRNYAMHTVYDLWNHKVSEQPRSFIAAATGPVELADTNNASSEGFEVQLTYEGVANDHMIDYTSIRKGNAKDGKGGLVRRKCCIGAEGCKGQSTSECHHRACKRKHNSSVNRYGSYYGTFICKNHACTRVKHWRDVWTLANASD